jgi:hypothetical protein
MSPPITNPVKDSLIEMLNTILNILPKEEIIIAFENKYGYSPELKSQFESIVNEYTIHKEKELELIKTLNDVRFKAKQNEYLIEDIIKDSKRLKKLKKKLKPID